MRNGKQKVRKTLVLSDTTVVSLTLCFVCGWLVWKAHQREEKSIKAVFTCLKLNKALTGSKQVLSLHLFSNQNSAEIFMRLFNLPQKLGFFKLLCGSRYDFQNLPIILIEERFLCAFRVRVKEL